MTSALDICRTDLYTDADELRARYPLAVVERVLRIRDMHQWMLGSPEAKDSRFVAEAVERHGISKVQAYADLKVIKSLLPHLAKATREFHKWRYNEITLSIIEAAREKGDLKTMQKAVADYAKYNRIDIEEQEKTPYERIVPQPFTATEDPRVLGIEPIPDIQERIRKMIEKYSAESADIEDVEFEEVDLGFDELFGESSPPEGDTPERPAEPATDRLLI